MCKVKIVSSILCEDGRVIPEQVTYSNLQQFFYYGEVMKILDSHCGVLRLSATLDYGGYGYGPVVGSEGHDRIAIIIGRVCASVRETRDWSSINSHISG